jgi:hypothetical protein
LSPPVLPNKPLIYKLRTDIPDLLVHSRSTPSFNTSLPVETIFITTKMSRAPSASNRPTHIPLPTSPYINRSDTVSPTPGQGPGPASPTSPRSSFLPSFMRTRSRAATLTTRGFGAASPNSEIPNPLGGGVAGGGGASTIRSSAVGSAVRDHSAGPSGGESGVTRSLSTQAAANLATNTGNLTFPGWKWLCLC